MELRVGFIGSVVFSAKILHFLLDQDVSIAGVITKIQKGINEDHEDLSSICDTYHIAYRQSDGNMEEQHIRFFQSLELDFIFCFGWSHLLPEEILKIPRLGVLGYHPTLLPMNRGRHPLIWALCLGLKVTGSSIFLMQEDADSGPILNQHKIPITYQDDAATLYQKMIDTAILQLAELLPSLKNKNFDSTPQDATKANYWRKRRKLDGKIDFRMPTFAIYNLVRALTRPYVGAHIQIGDEEMKVWKVKEISNDSQNIEPGKILSISDAGFIVKCLDGAILVEDFDKIFDLKVGGYFK